MEDTNEKIDDLKKIMMDSFQKLNGKIDDLNRNRNNNTNPEVNYSLEIRADNNSMDNNEN